MRYHYPMQLTLGQTWRDIGVEIKTNEHAWWEWLRRIGLEDHRGNIRRIFLAKFYLGSDFSLNQGWDEELLTFFLNETLQDTLDTKTISYPSNPQLALSNFRFIAIANGIDDGVILEYSENNQVLARSERVDYSLLKYFPNLTICQAWGNISGLFRRGLETCR